MKKSINSILYIIGIATSVIFAISFFMVFIQAIQTPTGPNLIVGVICLVIAFLLLRLAYKLNEKQKNTSGSKPPETVKTDTTNISGGSDTGNPYYYYTNYKEPSKK